MTDTEERFYHVVASKWPTGQLSIYAHGSEVQYGTMESAEAFLKYVNSKNSARDYKIYRVVF